MTSWRSAASLAALAAIACDIGGSRGTLVDDARNAVARDAPATRVVSLSPATTELLFAIGAGASVVGRTRWAEYPPEVADIATVGDGLNPNVELIVARRPDLVVFYDTPSNAPTIERLHSFGIATASVRLDRLSDLGPAARLLGRLTGTRPRADSVAAAFQHELDQLNSVVSGRRPRIVLLSWDSPPVVIGAGSFLNDILELAGATNVFHDLPQPSATVSIEAIAERGPDRILLVGDGGATFVGRPEWQPVEAVRERRISRVRGSEFSWPSFRAIRAIDELRRVLREARP